MRLVFKIGWTQVGCLWISHGCCDLQAEKTSYNLHTVWYMVNLFMMCHCHVFGQCRAEEWMSNWHQLWWFAWVLKIVLPGYIHHVLLQCWCIMMLHRYLCYTLLLNIASQCFLSLVPVAVICPLCWFHSSCFPFLPTTSPYFPLSPMTCEARPVPTFKKWMWTSIEFWSDFLRMQGSNFDADVAQEICVSFFCSRNLSWSSRLRNRKPMMKLPATKIQKDYRVLFWSIRRFVLHMDPGSEHGSFRLKTWRESRMYILFDHFVYRDWP